MNTKHLDPMDNRKLSKDDAEFLRLVYLVLEDRKCRKCGKEIVGRGWEATLCIGCADDIFREYHRKYAKVAWQRTKAKRAASLDDAAA